VEVPPFFFFGRGLSRSLDASWIGEQFLFFLHLSLPSPLPDEHPAFRIFDLIVGFDTPSSWLRHLFHLFPLFVLRRLRLGTRSRLATHFSGPSLLFFPLSPLRAIRELCLNMLPLPTVWVFVFPFFAMALAK